MAERQQYTIGKNHFILCPAPVEEQGFCFTQNQPPAADACVGYLCGDFGSTGTEFYHIWQPQTPALATDSFREEMAAVVKGLRQNGLLKDRPTMAARVLRFRPAQIPSAPGAVLAFRIETSAHIFFLRCTPDKGERNFFLYGYHKARFLEILRQQKGLPRIAWAELDSSHEVVAVRYGETGYRHWDTSGYIAMTPGQIVDQLNGTAQITKAQAAAMKAGALFGWHCPAADPRHYGSQGRPARQTEVTRQEVR